jgi:hypothetical protein
MRSTFFCRTAVQNEVGARGSLLRNRVLFWESLSYISYIGDPQQKFPILGTTVLVPAVPVYIAGLFA